MFVKSQKCDPCGVRTPPVRAEIAAAVKFFLINPIEPAVENFLVAVASQGAFAPLHAQVFNVEISATDETHHATVGTEAFPNFFFGTTGQANRAVAAEFVIEEIVSEGN